MLKGNKSYSKKKRERASKVEGLEMEEEEEGGEGWLYIK